MRAGWLRCPGDVFGDQAVVVAMVARIVYDADVITLKGAGYGFREQGIDGFSSVAAATGDAETQTASNRSTVQTPKASGDAAPSTHSPSDVKGLETTLG